ncbi:hypothetical protein ACFLZN_01235 [Nanoarchaeota archaeon]
MAVQSFTKKGAIKMFETLGVLIVFMILLGFALIFYGQIQKGELQESLAKQVDRKSIEISLKAVSMPELDCSTVAQTEQTCIDLFKLESFAEILTDDNNKLEYFDVFENSKMEVKDIFSNKTWIVYNNRPDFVKTELLFVSPILIKEPLSESKNMGIVEVTVYGQ